MTYEVPLQDMQFVLQHVAGLSDVLQLPGYQDFTIDIVEAVLHENARIAEQVIAPLNRVGDIYPPRWDGGEVTCPPGYQQAFRTYGEGGWQGLSHPLQFGGQGMPKLVAAACMESLEGACLAFSLCPLLTDGVIEALLAVGSPAQQQLFIPPLVHGKWTGTMNLTEPQAGSDLAQVRTRAEPQGDGTYRLFGQKIFITFGEHDLAENIVHLVLARTPGAPPGVKGLSLFIVPKYLVNADGSLGYRNDVYCASLEHKLGIHGSPTAVLVYGEGNGGTHPGALGHLIGEEGRGLEYMFVTMNAARFAVGMQGVAISQRATQQAVQFAAQRLQGRPVDAPPTAQEPVAIHEHPDVQRMLLHMQSVTEAGRALTYVAASQLDFALQHPDKTHRKRAAAIYDYLVPVVKGFCAEMAQEVVSLGLQVHGGMGYVEETGAAQLFRDARILPIYEGTTAIQANDLLARKTLRDGGTVARALIAVMRETAQQLGSSEQATLITIGQRVASAADDFAAAVEFLVGHHTVSLRDTFAGSVPYLMLAGLALSGWQMARAALVCQSEAVSDRQRVTKLASALFYATHILPRTCALRTAITEGGRAVRYNGPR